MPDRIFISDVKKRTKADHLISLGLIVIIIFFMGAGIISYTNVRNLRVNSDLVTHTHDVLINLSELSILMNDVETGQRGYIITGKEEYLEPYNAAIPRIEENIDNISRLTRDNLDYQNDILQLRNHTRAKLDELNETIELRRNQGFNPARDIILTNRGKIHMDEIRKISEGIHYKENALRKERIGEMEKSYQIAVVSGILTGLLGAFLSSIIAYMIQRSATSRRRHEWLQSGEAGLSATMLGDLRIEQLGESILKFLAQYVGAHIGAIYINHGDVYEKTATYGVSSDSEVLPEFYSGEGLLGQAARDKRAFILRNIPQGYMTINSALWQGKSKNIIIAPCVIDNHSNAVLELGFVHPVEDITLEFLEAVSQFVGIAVRTAKFRSDLQNLLEETQSQSEELQAQSEELRVSNEELHEQSLALRESQVRLEQQQAELEQTNTQLEEQTQLLEDQKEDLERAKSVVQAKVRELEQASQYKSDFLANMSHELRTPLNSSLILAKLLADNTSGNLTDEQVKFAQTIQTSGNDLLSLINDVLDLSKIEAGHMDIRVEKVSIPRLMKDFIRSLNPVVQQKGLTFHTSITKGCPETIETDRMRLEQIIRNLLSNAIKFTEKGQIELVAGRNDDGDIIFSVKDSGIGIAEDKQQAIFEAFQQADGTISRKYGGTGLGLSISRELSRLLGGHIGLTSSLGQGSTFTLTIPEIYNADNVQPRSRTAHDTKKSSEISETLGPKSKESVRALNIRDDRDDLEDKSRVLLVVEDDESFAEILFEMSHELGFQCLVAGTAEEGFSDAKKYLPHAIVLDVGLPDNSGLSVLDRLKRNIRTRHIPVHVISASDHSRTAMSLGALGYMTKPVKREQLVETLKKLEKKLDQRVGRVLIVEDDHVQRDSVGKLLASKDVETVGVGSAAECLEQLKGGSFDCMVLDLSLPDASGYSLLETLSKQEEYAFPPVIVYTGRDLSMDEEQSLRRYSQSIIIKGAKSPERLLDEVTLFLHKVVSDLPIEQQRMLEKSGNRDAALEGRRILVVEDDVANIYALTSILEPRGAILQIARNGFEAIEALEKSKDDPKNSIDLVLMDVMMPEMDGMAATREIRKKDEWKKLPIIMLTAKAMRDDQEKCLEAGANDYMSKPLDVEKLLSLVRVWMPR